jgi:hypothetical protein
MLKSGQIVNRFISRLHFGSKCEYKITDLIENTNNEMKEKFDKLAEGKKVLQLYHCSKNIYQDGVIDSIFKNGFRIGSASNKGYGVYMASHSRYAHYWGGHHVFVCNVIADDTKMERYISEIYSPENNFEYVIKDTDIIYPVCYFKYAVTSDTADSKKIWTNACCDNCPEHKKNLKEEMFKRCDCPQSPTIDPADIEN